MFAGVLAGLPMGQRGTVLEAIAAAHMPHRLFVRDSGLIGADDPRLFELRVYQSTAPARLSAIFRRHGIRPLMEGTGAFLIPFDSLAAREKAWRELGADPEWAEARGESALREMAIYRPIFRSTTPWDATSAEYSPVTLPRSA